MFYNRPSNQWDNVLRWSSRVKKMRSSCDILTNGLFEVKLLPWPRNMWQLLAKMSSRKRSGHPLQVSPAPGILSWFNAALSTRTGDISEQWGRGKIPVSSRRSQGLDHRQLLAPLCALAFAALTCFFPVTAFQGREGKGSLSGNERVSEPGTLRVSSPPVEWRSGTSFGTSPYFVQTCSHARTLMPRSPELTRKQERQPTY